MLYSECHITPLATIYRTRTLPIRGDLLRRVGDQVGADSVIAETDVPMGYRLLDLEQILETRIHKIDKVMVKKIEDVVEEGEVIARAGGLIKTECVSPVQGKILDARNNKVLIEVTPQHVELKAFYPGEIASMIPDVGFVIEATGALIQGMWGTGQELRARLEVVVPSGDTPLTADKIAAAHMGTVLVGGRTLDVDAIAQAVHNQVRGVVVGSITSDLISTIESSPLSLIVTEGFGDFAMNPSAFDLFRAHSGREACFSPVTQTRWQVHRPEVVIPLPAEGRPPVAERGASLTVGTRVRALRAPYENALGEVVSLPQHRQRVESGIRARGVEVDLESVGKVFIPFENLEIIL